MRELKHPKCHPRAGVLSARKIIYGCQEYSKQTFSICFEYSRWSAANAAFLRFHIFNVIE